MNCYNIAPMWQILKQCLALFYIKFTKENSALDYEKKSLALVLTLIPFYICEVT